MAEECSALEGYQRRILDICDGADTLRHRGWRRYHGGERASERKSLTSRQDRSRRRSRGRGLQVCTSTAGSSHKFFNSLTPTNAPDTPEYGAKRPEVNLPLLEASGLASERALALGKASSTGGRFFISHRGKQITTRDDFVALSQGDLAAQDAA
jgi:hypothetical protein